MKGQGTGAPCLLESENEKREREKRIRVMMMNTKAMIRTPTLALNQGGAESMGDSGEGIRPVKALPTQSPTTAGASAAVELLQTQKEVQVSEEGAQKPHPLTPLTTGVKKQDTGSQEEGDKTKVTTTCLDHGDVRRWTHLLSVSATSLRTRGGGCQLM